MNAFSHATSRVLPNRRSDQYTPGLHGHPSTILIGARDSDPTDGRRTSTAKLPSLADLSLLRVLPNSVPNSSSQS